MISKKKIHVLAIIAALVMACTLIGCSGGQETSSTSASSQAKLVIVHTNDTHGYAQAADGCLGYAAVAQLKADYEAQGYDVLLFDAGDALQGNLLVDDSKGEVVPEFMNACGYDAMVLGNHEFDHGADVLEERVAAMDYPALCANIIVKATGEPFVQPNAIFDLSDGTKVGVFGLDTPESMTKTDPTRVAGLAAAQGEDLYTCAQVQIDELKSKDCDLIICLGHLGEDGSSAPNRASDVIANTEGIDLFINGHDHKVQNELLKDKAGNDVLVAETGSYLANIGVITYEGGVFEEMLVAADEYDGSNAELVKQIDDVAADIKERMAEKVGTTSFVLDVEHPSVRSNEANLGDFVTDAVKWEARQALGSDPDACIVNGGGMRKSVAVGDVTLGDLHNVYPYSNQVATIEVTGEQLLEALEAACQGSPEPMGSFPQVSGITYELDTSVPYEKGEQYPDSTFYKPANPGLRITIKDVGGKGFDLDGKYLIATSDFIAHGGDTYYCFAEAAQGSFRTTGYTFYEALRYYLEDECEGVVPDVYAQSQNRITVK